MKTSLFLSTIAALSCQGLAESPIDYCSTINENFARGACGDPVKGDDGIIREKCSDWGEKAICTRSDTIIYGIETLDIETHPDGAFQEHTCTRFTSADAGYTRYCTTLKTCSHREGVCEFEVYVNDAQCRVTIETCEEPGNAQSHSRASGLPLLAPVVDCPFDKDLKWNGCTEKPSNPGLDGIGLHASFLSVVLADPTPASDFTSSGSQSSLLVTSAIAISGMLFLLF